MTPPANERVLVVDDDTRVRAALAALIDATPGLQVAATTASTADVVAIGRRVRATVAVVDVDSGQLAGGFSAIRGLAEHVTVVAVGDATAAGNRARDAGAIAVCDKNGNLDALTAAVQTAARTRPVSTAAIQVRRAGELARRLPQPGTP